jgi:2-polyprenyl-3-methyl-5-hydroxy-6-metoxy-1,4-benzoquinol methylase
MSLEDQVRWDRQHAQTRGAELPSRFLSEILEGGCWDIPRGRALDIACGKGRNALFLAEHGFDVVAMDISAVAIEEGRRRSEERSLAISWRQADLEQIELPRAGYDLIINFNYLERSLIAKMKSALRVGGHIIFETYLIDQKEIGHPKNPAYLLQHNELLDHFRELRVLCYREGKSLDGDELSFRAAILARKIR